MTATPAYSAQPGHQPTAPAPQALSGRWPHSLSHEPLLRVSDVLTLVQHEFPTLTTSKLRFLDNNGLVSPERTGSGYRTYSPADVERLRFVLRQQRDHFRPLTIIADHLDALDRGAMIEPVGPRALESGDPEYVTGPDLARRAGVSEDFVAQLDEARVVAQATPGEYEWGSVDLVVAAKSYVDAGGDVRTLRTLCLAATREADHAHNVGAPARARGRTDEAAEIARVLSESAIAVFGACVRARSSR